MAFDPNQIFTTRLLAPPNLAASTQRTCNLDIDKFRSRFAIGERCNVFGARPALLAGFNDECC